MAGHVCPWWFGYSFDNPVRRFVHDPAAIFGDLVEEGQTVADIGCGLGYFSLALARMVGPRGRVIAIDVQPQMLRRARKRAERRGLDDRIDFRPCDSDRLGLSDPLAFALAFWMVHEVPDERSFFGEIAGALEPSGRLLVAEPVIHVPASRFEKCVETARASGLEVVRGPKVRFSRTITCSRVGQP